MLIQKLSTVRTCRVYTSINKGDISRTWLALHGYGTLGADFYEHVLPSFPQDVKLLVPEGFNRYYVKGLGGKVGANWMTSEDRLSDIENIHSYLNGVISSNSEQISKTSFNVLGFSQGATTALRWWLSTQTPFISHMVIWAGSLPAEYSLQQIANHAIGTQLTIVYGTNDPLLNDDYLKQAEELVSMRRNCKIVKFEGQHEIIVEVLKALI